MKKPKLAHLAFVVTVAVKGVDGLVETLLGLLVAIAGPHKIFLLVLRFTVPELQNNPDNGVAKAVQSGAADLTTIGTFAVFYLLIHGVLKAGIAINLALGWLSNRLLRNHA